MPGTRGNDVEEAVVISNDVVSFKHGEFQVRKTGLSALITVCLVPTLLLQHSLADTDA